MTSLPIDSVLPQIVRDLLDARRLVLEAPPGAGKTTRVPPALLDALPGRIVVLEPRRIAARASAERVASELDETIGQRVGYRVRFESVPGSRIEYVTEGVFLRQLRTGDLEGVSCVIFDEFHERHLDADLALAIVDRLCAERDTLHLLVMSATLDAEAIAAHLNAPRIRSEGRSFPVTVEFIRGRDERRLEARVASGVRAVWPHGGDVLVFLPGVREIERCKEALRGVDAELLTLHGQLPPKEQGRVFRRTAKRRIILATNVAETSITVDGVTAVVDSGLVRMPFWDPATGLSRLSVTHVSQASAIQRAGRAGRTAPGMCLRLYNRSEFDSWPSHTPPEITRADTTELLLALHQLGHRVESLHWLDAPSPAAIREARRTLSRLGAFSGETLSERGKALARLPLHPRVGSVLLDTADAGEPQTGALAAAILSERDFLPRGEAEAKGSSDVEWRIEKLDRSDSRSDYHRPTMQRIRDAAKQLRTLVRTGNPPSRSSLRRSVFRAFSDRLARVVDEHDGRLSLLLASGGRAELAENSVVTDDEWLVALGTELRGPRGRQRAIVTLASGVDYSWIEEELGPEIQAVEELTLENGRVMATEGFKYGELWLERDRRPAPASDETAAFMVSELERRGLSALFKETDLEWTLGRLEVAQQGGIELASHNVEDALLRAACEGATQVEQVRGRDLAMLPW